MWFISEVCTLVCQQLTAPESRRSHYAAPFLPRRSVLDRTIKRCTRSPATTTHVSELFTKTTYCSFEVLVECERFVVEAFDVGRDM